MSKRLVTILKEIHLEMKILLSFELSSVEHKRRYLVTKQSAVAFDSHSIKIYQNIIFRVQQKKQVWNKAEDE